MRDGRMREGGATDVGAASELLSSDAEEELQWREDEEEEEKEEGEDERRVVGRDGAEEWEAIDERSERKGDRARCWTKA